MPSQYRKTPSYQWYLRGDAEGNRPPGMPAFNIDDQGRVVLAAGELFCRVSVDRHQTLCMDRHKFSSLGALKQHIRDAHEMQPAGSHAGGLTAREDQATAKYWKDVYDFSNGAAAEPRAPRKTKVVLGENALASPTVSSHPLPVDESRETSAMLYYISAKNLNEWEDYSQGN
ncbi:hypothetical protein F5X97DRAFT_318484 [Nemania serpens]|nr:hypothetical protein F5X97DRAFT_318484 [Nemania serpens]